MGKKYLTDDQGRAFYKIIGGEKHYLYKFIDSNIISNISYGRLYTWSVTQKTLITGFHVPSDDEWTEFTNYINSTYNQSPDDFGVGNHLKHRRQDDSPLEEPWDTDEHPRWNAHSTHYGRDTVNFGAFGGGYRSTNGSFSSIGTNGYWWSSIESSSALAWGRSMNHYSGTVGRGSYNKTNGFSVRLVRNTTQQEQFLTDGALLAKVQDYDGNYYDTVKIGTKVWTVQNLATTHYADGSAIAHVPDSTDWDNLTETSEAYCNYGNDESNVFFTAESNVKYGRLYTWAVTQKTLITGMHVASDDEWKTLEMHLGMSQADADSTGWRGTDEGRKLKHQRTAVGSPPVGISTDVHPRWDYHSTNFGLDTVNFGALPGGTRTISGNFSALGTFGHWWSSAEISSAIAWRRDMFHGFGSVGRGSSNKTRGYSLSCVRAATNPEKTLPDGVLLPKVQDYNGNYYDLVKIGDQVWTVQNFAGTNYADGEAIPHVPDAGDWADLTTTDEAYCNYDNDEDNVFLKDIPYGPGE